MRTEQQIATIVTRAMKNLHLDLAKKWGFPIGTIANATLGLGITMLIESGYGKEQIIDLVQQYVDSLTKPPPLRGA